MSIPPEPLSVLKNELLQKVVPEMIDRLARLGPARRNGGPCGSRKDSGICCCGPATEG